MKKKKNTEYKISENRTINCFPSLNCYQLSYSKSEEMKKTVSKLFNNDL